MEKIYRVIEDETTPITNWHTSEKYCLDYIGRSSRNLSIEENELIED